MQLRLVRRPTVDGAILGDLFLDGTRFSFTLERAAVAIPAGTYPVRLTVSGRAVRGELWTPDPNKRLPQICDVPGRDGIRLHALNTAAQSRGCPGVGLDEDATREVAQGIASTLDHSRDALTSLMSHLLDADARHDPITITIEAAGTERPVAV